MLSEGLRPVVLCSGKGSETLLFGMTRGAGNAAAIGAFSFKGADAEISCAGRVATSCSKGMRLVFTETFRCVEDGGSLF